MLSIFYKNKVYLYLISALFLIQSCNKLEISKYKSSIYTQKQVEQDLKTVEIGDPNNLEAVHYYNHLKNIMPHSSEKEKKYLLKTSFYFRKNFSLIQKNSDIVRELIQIELSYSLIDKVSNKQELNGTIHRILSYNTTDSPYSNYIEFNNTRRLLLVSCAEHIKNIISLHFYNKYRK